MLILIYLKASTSEQDAARAKNELIPFATDRLAQESEVILVEKIDRSVSLNLRNFSRILDFLTII